MVLQKYDAEIAKAMGSEAVRETEGLEVENRRLHERVAVLERRCEGYRLQPGLASLERKCEALQAELESVRDPSDVNRTVELRAQVIELERVVVDCKEAVGSDPSCNEALVNHIRGTQRDLAQIFDEVYTGIAFAMCDTAGNMLVNSWRDQARELLVKTLHVRVVQARVEVLETVAKSNITGIEAFVKMLPGKGLTGEERVAVYRAATVELLMHFKEMPDHREEEAE